MNKTFLPAILASLLFASCAGEPSVFTPVFTPEAENAGAEEARAFTVIGHKQSGQGGSLPEWAGVYLESGIRGIEELEAYKDRYVFVSRNEGRNFNALNFWNEGFSPGLDFPRLAASRIEARLSAGTPNPDRRYGAFYEQLILAASDAEWSGAVKEDDFWLSLRFAATEYEPETEVWSFLILVSIEKTSFVSQMNTIFQNIELVPPPSPEQQSAITQIKERFFIGF